MRWLTSPAGRSKRTVPEQPVKAMGARSTSAPPITSLSSLRERERRASVMRPGLIGNWCSSGMRRLVWMVASGWNSGSHIESGASPQCHSTAVSSAAVMSTRSAIHAGSPASSCRMSCVMEPLTSASQAEGTFFWFIMAIGPQAAQPYSVNISGQQRTARPLAPVSRCTSSSAQNTRKERSSCSASTSATPATCASTRSRTAATRAGSVARARAKSSGSSTWSTRMPVRRASSAGSYSQVSKPSG